MTIGGGAAAMKDTGGGVISTAHILKNQLPNTLATGIHDSADFSEFHSSAALHTLETRTLATHILRISYTHSLSLPRSLALSLSMSALPGIGFWTGMYSWRLQQLHKSNTQVCMCVCTYVVYVCNVRMCMSMY